MGVYSIERDDEVDDENDWTVEDCLTTLLDTRVLETELTDWETIFDVSSASMLADFWITCIFPMSFSNSDDEDCKDDEDSLMTLPLSAAFVISMLC